jgi:PAS domain S-box-containing protein
MTDPRPFALADLDPPLAQSIQAAVLDSNADAVWVIDHQYRLLISNARYVSGFADSFGQPPVVGASAIDNVPPEMARQWRVWYDRALAGERFVAQFNPVLDGRMRHAEIHLRPIEVDGVIRGAHGVYRDITDRVEADDARQNLEHNLQAIIDGMPDAIYAVNRERRLTTFNRTFADGLQAWRGHPPQIGDSMLDFPVNARLEAIADAYTRALAGEQVVGEYPTPLGGTTLTLEHAFTPIRTATEITGVWCVTKDITVRRNQEDDLRRQKDLAEAATRAKSGFLAVVSHEIRTPLHAVLGMTDLLLETRLDDEQREYAESLQQAAGTLRTLLDDILDFSKLEAGKLSLHPETIALDSLIREVAEPVAARAFDKGLDFVLHLDPALPQEVLTDGNRLRQVLLNLLGNALKFTDTGAIGLEVRSGGTPRAGKTRIEITVRDTGIGIPADKQAALFQRFSQADTSTTRRFGGTGLGLAISQELIRAMGGDISLESVDNVGAAFRIHLDMAVTTPAPAYRQVLRQRRVLAMTSQPWRQAALLDYAECQGADLRIADSPEAAKRLHGEDWQPELVLIDWNAHTADKTADPVRGPNDWSVPAVLLLPIRLRRLRKAKIAQGYSDCVHDPALPSLLGSRLADVLHPGTRPPDVATTPPPAAPAAACGGRVLVVDDNAVNLKLAARVLEKLGCRVETALNGSEAVARVAQTRFDLILMDCQMPETDGYQATRAIRQLPDGRTVPIVALSAYGLPGDRERCIEAGMNDYLSKPTRRECLQDMLGRWLPAAPPDSPALIDGHGLLKLVDGDPELLAELVAAYQEAGPGLQADLLQAVEAGNPAALARAAHALKGTLLSLAADGSAEVAKSIELTARGGDVAAAAAGVEVLVRQLQRLPGELQALLDGSRQRFGA